MTHFAAQAVDKYYDRARIPKYEPTELRLSESGDCPRKRVLTLLQHPITHPTPAAALRTMEAGNVWEAWLVERIRESGVPLLPQVRVDAPYGSSGHIDVLAEPSDGLLIVEIKAVSQYTKVLPDPRHVTQVQSYLHFYGRHHGVPKAVILYMHRENGAGPFPYEVHYDPAVGEEIEATLGALRLYADTNRVPEIPAGMAADRFPCSWTSKTGGGYCAMYGHCWGNANAPNNS